jgi:hypothetical protein
MRKIKLAAKRERWGLTPYGRLLFLVLLFFVCVVFMKSVVPFLSDENTIEARVMVVEGYIPDYAFPEIIEIFHEDNYDLIITSGTSFDQGFYVSGVETAADLIAQSLLNLGFDSSKMAVVPVPPGTFRDRTYNSALVTFNFLSQYHPEVRAINIISLGPHARRSRYLFEMVYEPEFEVGNIVIPQLGINKQNWHKSSRGFRTVINECIAYVYVKLFFWPGKKEVLPSTKR